MSAYIDLLLKNIDVEKYQCFPNIAQHQNTGIDFYFSLGDSHESPVQSVWKKEQRNVSYRWGGGS